MAGDFPVTTFTSGNVLGASNLNSLSTALNGLVAQSGTYANQIALSDNTYTRPVPYAMAAGSVSSGSGSIASGNALKLYSFTFTTGRFTQAPFIVATISDTVGGSATLVARTTGASTSGFDLYVYNVGASTQTWSSALTVDWIAIQMTSASASNGWS